MSNIASKKKTYGVRGLMEFMAVIHCGKASVTVPFSGGTLTGYGVQPATFTTEDPMMQAIIEKSEYYSSGRIILVREMDGTGKYVIPVYNPDISEESANEKDQYETESHPSLATVDCTDTTEEGKSIIDVTDIDDARDYLSDNFGIARSSMRSQVSVMRAAEDHNIVFRGLE